MGSVELLVVPLVQLQNIVVRPNAGNGEISLDLSLFNSTSKRARGRLGISVSPQPKAWRLLEQISFGKRRRARPL